MKTTFSIPDDILRAKQDHSPTATAVLIISADKTEDLEFFYPYYRFVEAGFRVHVASPEGKFKGKMGYEMQETKFLSDVSAEDYDLLYIPGGKAPEALKKSEAALQLVRDFVSAGKPVAALCHGPQLLAEADVIRGRTISGWPEIENEVTEAGANFVSEQVTVDGPFITARWPADLPHHLREVIAIMEQTPENLRAAHVESATLGFGS